MASNLPQFLVAELRFAFRQCSQKHSLSVCRNFSTLHPRRFETAPTRHVPRTRNGPTTKPEHSKTPSKDADSHKKPANLSASSGESPITAQSARELVPQGQDKRAVGDRRTLDAPMKVIPKADITPNLRLTPRERLHLEILTRRAPPQIKQIKPYKQRLLIYHHGNVPNNALVFLKMLGLVCASAMTGVYVPAHYFAGTELWICGSLLVCGFVPAILFHHLLQPLATRIYLRLPPNARITPESAMDYAKKLPSSADIDIDFMRITGLPGTVTASIGDLRPIPRASRWPWQVANVRQVGDKVDKGSLLKPNPTEFFVKSETGVGKAKRDVIPGIWPAVYRRLMDGPPQEPVSRWRRS